MLKGELTFGQFTFFVYFCSRLLKYNMVKTLVVSIVIIAAGMLLLLVKVLLRRNGTFSSQHIHDSKAMKDRGIHCVMDQDREMRRTARTAVSERSE
jgi:hypothetical protein